jgi:hypothetical protein
MSADNEIMTSYGHLPMEHGYQTDPITAPAHYAVYPVQPIHITRHLGFCLGNTVKYMLRAPYKGGVEDVDKALQYLSWEELWGSAPLYVFTYKMMDRELSTLLDHLEDAEGDELWKALAAAQHDFLFELGEFLCADAAPGVDPMRKAALELREILAERDKPNGKYAGMTGLPEVRQRP